MLEAKDRDHYVNSWNSYIQQLNKLGMPLIKTSDKERDCFMELKECMDKLKELVIVAADIDFPEEK